MKSPSALASLSAVAATVTLVISAGALPASATPMATLPGVSSTDQVAVDTPLHRVFVLGDDDTHPAGRVLSILDARTDTVIGSPTPLSGADFVVADSVSHRVFVGDRDEGTIRVLDARTGGALTGPVFVADSLGEATVDPFQERILVTDTHRRLHVLDLDAKALRSPIAIPDGGTGVAVDFMSGRAYVPLDRGGIAVIDEGLSGVVATIPTPRPVTDIAADPIGHTLAVAGDSVLAAIDTRTDSVTFSTTMPPTPTRAISVDIVTHTFLITATDTELWAMKGTAINRLAANDIGNMGVDYLQHKIYAAQSGQPWVSVIWQ